MKPVILMVNPETRHNIKKTAVNLNMTMKDLLAWIFTDLGKLEEFTSQNLKVA